MYCCRTLEVPYRFHVTSLSPQPCFSGSNQGVKVPYRFRGLSILTNGHIFIAFYAIVISCAKVGKLN